MNQNKTTKNILLVVVLVIIVSSIWYIEAHKTTVVGGEFVALTDDSTISTSTPNISNGSTLVTSNSSRTNRNAILKEKAQKYSSAVELIPGGKFINADPFTLKSLIGKKVILLDFWTYSCINCQRVTPYLNAWYEKYKDQGLVIVGVHTPEFDFEKDYSNVVQGVKDLGITYPVVQDNNMATWNAYGNRYWPHEYLIDIDGYIVHDKIGEGGYDESEKAIQKALAERAQVLGLNEHISTSLVNPSAAISINPVMVESPETYFGSERNEFLANGKRGAAGTQTLIIPETINSNALYLGGTWNFSSQYATNQTGAKIIFNYNAKNVYFVASSDNGVTIKVLRDGKILSGSEVGKDVDVNGNVNIKANRLYSLINGTDYGQHTLEIDIENPGLNAFTFTFG